MAILAIVSRNTAQKYLAIIARYNLRTFVTISRELSDIVICNFKTVPRARDIDFLVAISSRRLTIISPHTDALRFSVCHVRAHAVTIALRDNDLLRSFVNQPLTIIVAIWRVATFRYNYIVTHYPATGNYTVTINTVRFIREITTVRSLIFLWFSFYFSNCRLYRYESVSTAFFLCEINSCCR